MAVLRIQPGNATLPAWVIAMRNAAEAGTAPREFAAVKPSDIIAGAQQRGVPVVEGRIHTDHVASVYFGTCDALGVVREPSRAGMWPGRDD